MAGDEKEGGKPNPEEMVTIRRGDLEKFLTESAKSIEKRFLAMIGPLSGLFSGNPEENRKIAERYLSGSIEREADKIIPNVIASKLQKLWGGETIEKAIKDFRNRKIATFVAIAALGLGGVAGGIYLNNKISNTEIGEMKTAYDGKIATLTAENNVLKAENEKLQEGVAANSRGIVSLAGAMTAAEEQLYGSKDKKSPGLVYRVSGVEGSAAKLDGEIYGVKEKKGLAARLGETEDRSNSNAQKTATLEGKVDGVAGRVTAVEGGVSGQKQIAEGLEKRLIVIEEGSKKYAILLKALDELRKTYEKDDDFVGALPYIKATLAAIEPELRRNSAEIYGAKEKKGLVGENEDLRKKYDELKAKQDRAASAYDTLRGRVDALERKNGG
jgi:cell division protein FtsB